MLLQLAELQEEQGEREFVDPVVAGISTQGRRLDLALVLNSKQRRTIHDWSEELGFQTFSRGSPVRQMVVHLGPAYPVDTVEVFGYVGIFGPSVEAFVDALTSEVWSQIPADAVEQKKRRDGPPHHITIFHKEIMDQRAARITDPPLESEESVDHFLRELAQEVGQHVDFSDCSSLGLGKAELNSSTAFFLVLEWPSMQRYLDSVGIHRDLHITLGFLNSDVHGIPKDATTLLSPPPPS